MVTERKEGCAWARAETSSPNHHLYDACILGGATHPSPAPPTLPRNVMTLHRRCNERQPAYYQNWATPFHAASNPKSASSMRRTGTRHHLYHAPSPTENPNSATSTAPLLLRPRTASPPTPTTPDNWLVDPDARRPPRHARDYFTRNEIPRLMRRPSKLYHGPPPRASAPPPPPAPGLYYPCICRTPH